MRGFRPGGDVLFVVGAMLILVSLVGTRTSLETWFRPLVWVGLLCASPGLVFIIASQPGTAVDVAGRVCLVLGLWFVGVGVVGGLGAPPVHPFWGLAASGGILLLADGALYAVTRASPGS